MGATYLIDHRKMGLGVFADDAEHKEDAIREIVTLLRMAHSASRAKRTGFTRVQVQFQSFCRTSKAAADIGSGLESHSGKKKPSN
jgi:hypothetical protein